MDKNMETNKNREDCRNDDIAEHPRSYRVEVRKSVICFRCVIFYLCDNWLLSMFARLFYCLTMAVFKCVDISAL